MLFYIHSDCASTGTKIDATIKITKRIFINNSNISNISIEYNKLRLFLFIFTEILANWFQN